MALALIKKKRKRSPVYDLGGGTFDISILKISNGVFDVLSTNGDTYLGGDDFDNAIVKFWIRQAGLNEKEVQSNKELSQQLRIKAEEAKRALSSTDNFLATINDKQFEISKEEFESLIKPFVDKTIASCKNAMKDAGIITDDIQDVVMVGGVNQSSFGCKKCF